AHEINNPNHLIQMNADLLDGFTHHILELLDDRLDEERHHLHLNGMSTDEITMAMPQLLTDIKASSRRMDRIGKDLTKFSRPRDNAGFWPVDLNQVIEKTRNLLTSALDKRRSRLDYVLAPQLPLTPSSSQR